MNKYKYKNLLKYWKEAKVTKTITNRRRNMQCLTKVLDHPVILAKN